jgi:nucleoside-diphosphate-sugar epimerase
MATISITGGTGFIGRHLISALSAASGSDLVALTHSRSEAGLPTAPNLRWQSGDLEGIDNQRQFLAPGGVLIHLAYPTGWNSRKHLIAAKKLAQHAAIAGVHRVILCSTAVVVGRTRSSRIDEDSPCSPVGTYERTKLEIERVFGKSGENSYQLAVLRPTAVLGPGGRNLAKLANDLRWGNPAINYLRSSLFGRRTMNLVCIENVVAAFMFLVRREQEKSREVYIVSDDDDPMNNYRDIERELMTRLSVKNYPLPPFDIPEAVLAGLLRLRNRSCSDPWRVYDGQRLVQKGFEKVSTISVCLKRFAESLGCEPGRIEQGNG